MFSLLLPALLMIAGTDAGAVDMLPDDPVLRTLMAGDAARGRGDHRALLEDAQLLRALGAKPADGQDDLATAWTQEAQSHGVTRSSLNFRGRALGPAYRHGSIGAGASMTVRQLFLAGQRAQISIAPTHKASHLSVRVLGTDGNTLCAKPVNGAQANCAWLPLFTDRYDIVIENGGAATEAFYMVVR